MGNRKGTQPQLSEGQPWALPDSLSSSLTDASYKDDVDQTVTAWTIRPSARRRRLTGRTRSDRFTGVAVVSSCRFSVHPLSQWLPGA